MEPVCWAGIAGVIAIAVAVGSLFKGSCKHSESSCGCHTQKKEDVPGSPVDAKKEKAIDDLTK